MPFLHEIDRVLAAEHGERVDRHALARLGESPLAVVRTPDRFSERFLGAGASQPSQRVRGEVEGVRVLEVDLRDQERDHARAERDERVGDLVEVTGVRVGVLLGGRSDFFPDRFDRGPHLLAGGELLGRRRLVALRENARGGDSGDQEGEDPHGEPSKYTARGDFRLSFVARSPNLRARRLPWR
jgi:hypothetical protein